MIDYQSAEVTFIQYVTNNFDLDNPKIKLKYIHTFGVVNSAKKITDKMNLPGEDRELAGVIALLHDIGRFEQLRQFDSFERTTMDHAAVGVELLFGPQKMIRDFLSDTKYDDIIRTAIAHHSDYALPKLADSQTKFHAALIRDADKLDNCRVKLEDSMEVMLGESAKQVGAESITDKVWETCMRNECIRSEDRVTKMDYWVSYVAYFFDINFNETWDIIMEEKYVSRIIERIPYTNPDTQNKMQLLQKMLLKK